jgi:hypothetical protein
MREVGGVAESEGAAYFTGGATAVLLGWRDTTIDIDVAFVPEQDSVLREIPRLKNTIQLNVELVLPSDFVPIPEGWQERSLFVAREGRLTFYHCDPYAQALAKLERAHPRDLEDVQAMIDRGLVDPDRALSYFAEIEQRLYRYPAVDPATFRRQVEEAFG